MHDQLKKNTGISNANCSTCCYLSTEGDGYEYNGSWPVCSEFARMGYLKSFPFKKDMKCWHPNFWCSIFADEIKNGTDEECRKAGENFKQAISV